MSASLASPVAPDIIVALDYGSGERALALVDSVGPQADFYKVGLQLFEAAGPAIVHALLARGKRVFLDLKFHDIPSTVGAAVDTAAQLGVEFLTVHVAGGPTMLRAAREAARGRVRLLGVTALTSLSAGELEEIWDRPIDSIAAETIRLGRIAREAGIDGVVASVHEAAELKRSFGEEFLVVTPGIRLTGDDSHDQRRTATPAAAARAGVDALVVGRSVTAAPDPVAALARLHRELRESGVQVS